MKVIISVDLRVSSGAEATQFMQALPKGLRDKCGEVPEHPV
jgi:hypothetical protein